MGAEARALGHGGIRLVAQAAGVREATVSAGVDELDAGGEPLGRARRPGAGRRRAADLDPGLRPALLALVEPDERGDPMSPLRWTTKSTRTLAAELTRQGHRVGPDTVADLLRAEKFSLQGNAKTLEGQRHPDRDGQFRYIAEQASAHHDSDDPVISVDTKKKENVGAFRNGGREWRPHGEPAEVSTHDFPNEALGKAIPYGIYDLAANTGWVNVGTDHDTAAFAVESIRRWWTAVGQTTYPAATRLLITADAGGSNGYRTRAWKAELAAFALATGLTITVCHFPPGTSKWNKREHRLFSHITMNWRGRPLTSHEVIVNTIAATTTRTGLTVTATLDAGTYPDGLKVSDTQMAALPLDRHDWHGDWNYTLRPEPPAPPTAATPASAGARPSRVGVPRAHRTRHRRMGPADLHAGRPPPPPARRGAAHRAWRAADPQARCRPPARAHPGRTGPGHRAPTPVRHTQTRPRHALRRLHRHRHYRDTRDREAPRPVRPPDPTSPDADQDPRRPRCPRREARDHTHTEDQTSALKIGRLLVGFC